jgi:tetratricopeptide (TPR) repeat protein
MRTLTDWPLGNRVGQAAYGLVFYVWKSLAPGGLAPLYEMPRGMNPFGAEYLLCYGLVAAGVVVVILCARRFSAVSAVAIAYAVLLAPILGFFQSGDQFVADRYSYVACIGWSILAGGSLAHAVRWAKSTKSFNPGLIMAAAAAVLLVLGVLTLNQASVWRDSLSLWEHSVRAGVATPAVRVNYGLNLEREGRSDEAVAQFRLAVKDRPDDGRAWYVLGNTLRSQKKFAEADVAYAEAAKFLPQRYIALVNRGNLLIRELKREQEGLLCLRAAVEDIERPNAGGGRQVSGVPYLALGAALGNSGDNAGAKTQFRKALDHADTRARAAEVLQSMGEKP